MQSKTLRTFLLLSVVLFLSIVAVQVFWFKKAYSLEDQDFDQRVNASLRVVAKRMLMYNNNPNNTLLKPVERVNGNYYTVQINDKIDPLVLEELLKQELLRHDIKQNVEYGIYDCVKNQIQYGGYVCTTAACDSSRNLKYEFPPMKLSNYYFGVYFTDRKLNVLSDMGNWLLSSLLLLVLFGFFAYALWVIFRQKRLSEVQTDFINNMTHEFKTPLSTISISSEVLMNPKTIQQPERLLSYATIINKEAQRLRKNVDNVLQTSKISQNLDALHFETVNLNELVEDFVQNMAPVVKEKGGTLIAKVPSQTIQLQADRLHLSNVLHNLVDNSLKYCNTNPEIQLSLLEQNNTAQLQVADNGIGIEINDQEHVFKKFFRVHTGNVHNVKGFGLGLYYVKEILKAHKAHITVQSKIGKGSTFIINIPLQHA
jgi:two-component system, OmpR family, phosphate regulon sensor histidine kinase PhoR